MGMGRAHGVCFDGCGFQVGIVPRQSGTGWPGRTDRRICSSEWARTERRLSFTNSAVVRPPAANGHIAPRRSRPGATAQTKPLSPRGTEQRNGPPLVLDREVPCSETAAIKPGQGQKRLRIGVNSTTLLGQGAGSCWRRYAAVGVGARSSAWPEPKCPRHRQWGEASPPRAPSSRVESTASRVLAGAEAHRGGVLLRQHDAIELPRHVGRVEGRQWEPADRRPVGLRLPVRKPRGFVIRRSLHLHVRRPSRADSRKPGGHPQVR